MCRAIGTIFHQFPDVKLDIEQSGQDIEPLITKLRKAHSSLLYSQYIYNHMWPCMWLYVHYMHNCMHNRRWLLTHIDYRSWRVHMQPAIPTQMLSDVTFSSSLMMMQWNVVGQCQQQSKRQVMASSQSAQRDFSSPLQSMTNTLRIQQGQSCVDVIWF